MILQQHKPTLSTFCYSIDTITCCTIHHFIMRSDEWALSNIKFFFSRMWEGKSFYIWLMQIIGLLGLIVLCLWLSLRPKSPSYSIVFISIEQPSNSNENGTVFYNLEIENSNKDSSIYYDDTILSFLYGQDEDEVGETTISSFNQGTRNTRDVSSNVNAKPRPFKPLLNAISNATAELKVALMTKYRYKTWGIKSKFHGVHLKGILPIDSNGKLSRKKKKYRLRSNSKKLGKSLISRCKQKQEQA